ncbi:MAG: hypothetical protein A3F72_02805 [Bacteroidetes bacterium RIFCSPLOWO2_12_FULL_35_15]|nr:MAG: hypothetical protein A3F72_02805 [Bacteroidetes bacterium RIFCSPLOWO2_12_FULL_35_15]
MNQLPLNFCLADYLKFKSSIQESVEDLIYVIFSLNFNTYLALGFTKSKQKPTQKQSILLVFCFFVKM